MPSQSLSRPSQTSCAYWHWQTSPDRPVTAPQVQPATQAVAELQVLVQTLPVQVLSPAGWPSRGCPTGRQIPLGQSLFLSQGVPAAPLCGWAQLPLSQIRAPLQVLPAQQACEAEPQGDPPVVPPEEPVVPLPLVVEPVIDTPLVAPRVVAPVPLLVEPLGPELLPNTVQMLDRQTRSPLQLTRLQQAWP